MLGRVLVAAAVAWPLVAGAAVWQRASSPAEVPVWTVLVYAAAGRICHQIPERSFHAAGVAFPVCARCTGLYLAASFAAVWASRRRARSGPESSPLFLVALAAIPTALTLAWEWGGLGTPSNLMRFALALPLGGAVAVIVIGVTSPRSHQH